MAAFRPFFISVFALFSTVASAQDTPTVQKTFVALEELTVLREKLPNSRSADAGKLPVPARDMPMSISIVDKNLFEQRQVLRIDEALQMVPGIYLMGETGGYQQEIAGRGYAYNSSNTFKNGIRYNNGVMPEVSALEKVEVLKGSAAVLYGNVTAGGMLNLVTKKPRFERGGEVGFRTGSYDLYKPVFDVYGAVADSRHVAFRLNGAMEKAGSFRDKVQSNRYYINPSVYFLLGKKTTVLLEGDYLKDRRTLDYGTGAINYVLANVPRNTFLGASWGYVALEQQGAVLTTTHEWKPGWKLRNITGVQDFSNDIFGTTRPNSGNFVQADGKWIRGIQRSGIRERYYSTQLDVTGSFSTGKLGHTILAGGDWDRYKTLSNAYNVPSRYDSVNIFNLNAYRQRNDIPDVTLKTETTVPLTRYGVFFQDLVAVSKTLKVLAGVRYTVQQTGSMVRTIANDSTATTSLQDGAFTPRIGAVYQPNGRISLFASYANSFALNTGVDISGNALPPSFIDQYEAGLKSEWLNRRLTANVSVYRIINSNLAQTSLQNGNTNTNIKELGGEVTSQGAELELLYHLGSTFTASAAYSYNDTRYTRSTMYVEGSRLRYNPNHTANLYMQWGNICFAPGLSVNGAVYYVGNRVAGRSTRVQVANDAYRLMELPDYVLVEAGVGYTWRTVTVRLKLTNIGNVLSYNVHDDNSVQPIAPRQFAASVTCRF